MYVLKEENSREQEEEGDQEDSKLNFMRAFSAILDKYIILQII
jgi:hypothetical protein